MMARDEVPSMELPMEVFGDQGSGYDLATLLYLGAAKENTRVVRDIVASGNLGRPRLNRLSLVTALYDEILGGLAGGGSRYSAKTRLSNLRVFYAWADEGAIDLSVDNVETCFLEWSDQLLRRVRELKEIKERSAYTMSACVGSVLDEILERSVPLVESTLLRPSLRRKSFASVAVEKQNLAETFAFGRMLTDICSALTPEAVLTAPLPIRVPLQNGLQIIRWSGASDPESKSPWTQAGLAAYSADGTLRTRYSLANMRMEAELLMFIAQTGMNFAEVERLKLSSVSYASHLDGYRVVERKGRRQGDVSFEIFREYREHFERYLDFRRRLFPDSGMLFPFVGRSTALGKNRHFELRLDCKELGLPFISPRALRGTRVNWLLRQSGDPDLTAEMAQHTKRTLLQIYAKPSMQRSVGEIARFWTQHDPTLERTASVVNGECFGAPRAVEDIPVGVLRPDCLRPSGCLWCEHHRDVDYLDYVWSLASFGHLKTIEFTRAMHPAELGEGAPSELVRRRVVEKLNWFRESSAVRKAWVEESILRIEEGDYHPAWEPSIRAIEGWL